MAEGAVLDLAKSVLCELGNYATDKIHSAWIAKIDLAKLKRSLGIICLFIEDAEKKQSCSATIRQWVKELKHVVYDIDDLLDEASTDAQQLNLLKRSSKVCYYLSYAKHKVISPFSLSNKIKEIRDCLDEINSNIIQLNLTVNLEPEHVPQSSHRRITYALPNISRSNNIRGRDEAKSEILRRVLSNDVDNCHGLSVLPIVGIGGLGKTALARLVYLDSAVEKKFDIKLWGCVSDPFKLDLVLRSMLQSIGKKGSTEAQMVAELGSIVRDKRYFLVLDDVWTRNPNEWNSLKEILACGGAKGSVILVTTRDRGVAMRTIGARNYYDLEKLPAHLCMSVFLENAFSEGEHERYPHLVKVGKAIVAKCGGVPLALKTLGSSLRGQKDEKVWRRVAESELWNVLQKEGDILPALKLSYDALDSQLKSCFAYWSVFPKGYEVHSQMIINLWIAQGFIKHDSYQYCDLEDIGLEYLDELVSRSLLEISLVNKEVLFKMHELVHDLARSIMGEQLALVSCGNPSASRSVRHLAWDNNDDLSSVELPRQLMFQTQQVRTFTWQYRMGSVNKAFIKQILLTFKCLRCLSIGSCDIEDIPDSFRKLKHLRYLDLSSCTKIKALPPSICKLPNLQMLSVIDCHQLVKLPIDMGKLINLRCLSLTIQSEYVFPKGMRAFGNLPSLCNLRISECRELISLFPEEEDDVLGKITFLTQLHILGVSECPKLSSLISHGLVYLTALEELYISDCESLDWRVESQSKLGGMMPVGLHNLKSLGINNVPKLVELPNGLESAALSLRSLLIDSCEGLTSLPDWLKSCKSLNEMIIMYCPNLASTLPAEVLKSLQRLEIAGCPNLSLSKEVIIEDWLPYISHIPNVEIRGINGHEDLLWEDGIRK